MRCIEHYLQDPENHLLLAEDKRGLFIWFRQDTDAVNQAMEDLRSLPGIKWFRVFSNQREGNPALGASEAVAAIFEEIQQRNLNPSVGLSNILNEEVRDDTMRAREDASPSR